MSTEVELASEEFGDPADPPVLLVMGAGASMLWWDDGFCRLVADRGLRVIRYDHRDTGRSTTVAPGAATYTGADLVADAGRVLDTHGVESAHVVGMSMGGMLAQRLALDHPGRVRSLTLIATSPGGDDLPGMSAEYAAFVSAEPDGSPVDLVVEDCRFLTGSGRSFDQAATRVFVQRDADRAIDPASAANHFSATGFGEPTRPRLGSITVPTVVVHGTSDPLFPFPHGEALAREIPGARLVALDGAGHEVHRDDWAAIAHAIPA